MNINSELRVFLCVVWVCAKQSSLAEVKALKPVEYFAERHGFFTNFHSRAMKCKLGEYAGKYSHAMPSVSAPDCPRAHRIASPLALPSCNRESSPNRP